MLEIFYCSGHCPVEAEGTFDGLSFYFRARNDSYTLSVAENADIRAVDIAVYDTVTYSYYEGGMFYNSGWMEHADAIRIVEEGYWRFQKNQERRKMENEQRAKIEQGREEEA